MHVNLQCIHKTVKLHIVNIPTMHVLNYVLVHSNCWYNVLSTSGVYLFGTGCIVNKSIWSPIANSIKVHSRTVHWPMQFHE